MYVYTNKVKYASGEQLPELLTRHAAVEFIAHCGRVADKSNSATLSNNKDSAIR